MSHRFPPLARQAELDRNRSQSQARAVALPVVPSLPWFELALGFAALIVLLGL